MKRLLLSDLLHWKDQPERKPLLIDGARQTGKTYLLQTLLGQHFAQVLRIDFLESPELAEAFANSLSPTDVLSNIELLTGKPFNPRSDLLILDEIGECPRAVTSLKYFAEKAP
ncbi:MAG: AAA family ATPase, partial [Paraperlucidibaca sp.]